MSKECRDATFRRLPALYIKAVSNSYNDAEPDGFWSAGVIPGLPSISACGI